ncbi:unnamed protein product, partial [Trypanosoma congolense IL3000]
APAHHVKEYEVCCQAAVRSLVCEGEAWLLLGNLGKAISGTHVMPSLMSPIPGA